MKVSIHSRDTLKDESPGKKFCVSSDTLTIRSAKNDRGGRWLIISGEEKERMGDFENATMPRDMERNVRIQFSPSDLKQILDAAIKAKPSTNRVRCRFYGQEINATAKRCTPTIYAALSFPISMVKPSTSSHLPLPGAAT